VRVLDHRFNKREEDFDSRAEWDNYLEEREDIAFNLIENIDVAAATERLSRYEQENAESIVAVAARQVLLVSQAADHACWLSGARYTRKAAVLSAS
jgi:CDK-activating kinase assembly factor MAT1